jgi:16S rRNA (cytosine1402-N4)-methyltransferase
MVHGLKSGGRLAIITFHSLEDRIVKRVFKELETDCICNKNLPVCVCGKKKEIDIITKKPIIAGDSELNYNTRAKSAKLRIAQKI